MVTIGYFLSSEEHSGAELVQLAAAAERAGFRKASISNLTLNPAASEIVWLGKSAVRE